ncbi:MAG: small ribosomal subunit Rsm22 family protein [Verrucomicrobiota bacterium]
MDWDSLDWNALDRLRAGFLAGRPAGEPYWRGESDLAAYDLTYAERIGWKWDAVLGELAARRWRPRSRVILDWGCGSGVAARRVIGAFGGDAFDRLQVWDHSPAARAFAARRAGELFPGLDVIENVDPSSTDGPVGLLVVSHVLNELSPAQREQLLALIARAEEVVWVEPGTHAVGRDLAALRDRLKQDFSVIAPCPHAAPCGLFAEGRERDWCHFFAPPPPALPADPRWVRFAQRAGVDLRSLPYSFLVLDRAPPASPPPADAGRMIGRPDVMKPYARFLGCEADGLPLLELPKRVDGAMVKALAKHPPAALYRWRHSGGRITEIETLVPARPDNADA